MKKSRLIVIIIVVACAVIALFSFKGLLTPYVPFEEAKQGGYVQVLGHLVKSVPVINSTHGFIFTLEDENSNRLKVMHNGSKPLNFEHATSIVAIGAYNKETGIFEADKILVKCPSKYTKENN